RQTLQLPVRLRDRVGDQGRQAWPHVEEPVLLRHHHRILEFDGCYLLARPVDFVGHTELRQSPTHADHGHGTRRSSGALPQRQGRERIPMMTPERAQDILDRAKKLTSADDIEIIVGGGNSALTRFANNTIHQNVSEQGYVVSVRTVIDGKTARATTNKTDDDSLRRAIQSAEQLTRVQERDS